MGYLSTDPSLFGGHRERGESYLRCLVREIQEEIGYFVPPGDFKYLTSYEAVDCELDGPLIQDEFFCRARHSG
jgi:8-oxo-dGTP pyrophosphatase MutT (NUDIX family)